MSGSLRLFRDMQNDKSADGSSTRAAVLAMPTKALRRAVGAITFRSGHSAGFTKDAIDFAQRAMALCSVAVLGKPVEQSAPEQALDRIVDAIATILEGFALYDSYGRLMLANETYRKMLYPGHEDLVKSGMTFEQVVRKALPLNVITDAVGREEEWLAQRLKRHDNSEGPKMQSRTSAGWIKISECKTHENGTVAISELPNATVPSFEIPCT